MRMSCSLSLVYSFFAQYVTEIFIKILLLLLGLQSLADLNTKELCNMVKEARIFKPSYVFCWYKMAKRTHLSRIWIFDEGKKNGKIIRYKFGERVRADLTRKIEPMHLYNIKNPIISISCEISNSVVYVIRKSSLKDGLILFHKNEETFFFLLL